MRPVASLVDKEARVRVFRKSAAGIAVLSLALCLADVSKAHPARETVSCPSNGYSLSIPKGWQLLQTGCSDHFVMDASLYATITVTVDRPHPAPSMAAMRADLRRRGIVYGTPARPPDYSDRTIHGIPYAAVTAELKSNSGLNLAVRMLETYRAGRRVTVVGSVFETGSNPAIAKDTTDMGQVFTSLRLL